MSWFLVVFFFSYSLQGFQELHRPTAHFCDVEGSLIASLSPVKSLGTQVFAASAVASTAASNILLISPKE